MKGHKQVIWFKDGSVKVVMNGRERVFTVAEFDSKSEEQLEQEFVFTHQLTRASLVGARVFSDKAYEEGFIDDNTQQLLNTVFDFIERVGLNNQQLAREFQDMMSRYRVNAKVGWMPMKVKMP